MTDNSGRVKPPCIHCGTIALVKIVYLVLAHHNAPHFKRNTAALGEGGSPIFAHVDAKADESLFRVDGINFTAKRENVRWGGWSLVQATLNLMHAASSVVEPDDYVILLSGDSYPLQSQASISKFLPDARNGIQYINSLPFPSPVAEKPLTRLSRLYVEYDPRSERRNVIPRAINKMKIPRPYKRAVDGRSLFCGSQWWALTGAAFQWLMAEQVAAEKLTRFCRHMFVPDEFYFHTLLGQCPEMREVRRNLIFADWYRPTGPRPSIIDSQHVDQLSLPGALLMENRGYLAGPALFARKFPADSEHLISRIREEVWPNAIPATGAEFTGVIQD
ncbi:hypothetical protein JWS13_14430 [Rhodococcus pseudokoreensis]|uniref:Peptide O-xylosyltransferase n=1 Tax=Rhodococcus pseudokoreensis TaxID=2811421 RepID=A0A974W1T4_9NOCA|nr:beta-1,6-N-acetylglucosaminyltransferase [Rhodococcus pseudokoreensis]QSE89743.1 hypothetical protein JWS13_14430 [Rhodococcus pseudokoreensis]